MDVPVELSRILIGELSDVQVIELREIDGERRLPIVVGVAEAFAIERRVKQIPVPRPMTHELLSSVILSLGARLDRVLIHDLSEGTFYAVLCLEREYAGERLLVALNFAGEPRELDAPKDAQALDDAPAMVNGSWRDGRLTLPAYGIAIARCITDSEETSWDI